MAKMGKSMRIASRLAAATALTGTLAACDGRFGRAAQEVFAPLPSHDPVEAAQRSPAPAAPGNPVYIDGSKEANDRGYREAYGAPLAGSGQQIAAPPTYAPSVYEDDSIASTPITGVAGISTVVAEPVVAAPVVTTGSGAYDTVIPAPQSVPYVAPVQQSFPVIGEQPTYLPQSATTPQHLLPQAIFSDASTGGTRIEVDSLLAELPDRVEQQYGSTASHRFSARRASDGDIAFVDTASLPMSAPVDGGISYSMPVEIMDAETSGSGFAAAPLDPVETVELASLGTYAPLPRARPARLGASETAPIPAPRTAPRTVAVGLDIETTPLPIRRPMQYASLSGRAITDAPALTEPPQMIEVEPVFVDEPMAEAADTPESVDVDVAALTPTETMVDTAAEVAIPEPTVAAAESARDEAPSDTPVLRVIEPEDLAAELAEADSTKLASIDPGIDPAPAQKAAPRVEIDADIGDLKELSGTSWRLATLNGAPVVATAELHFDGNSGFAGGQGICNNYGGEFKEDLEGTFAMGNIFSTETRCENIDLEKEYIVTLEAASQYRTAPGLRELKLLNDRGEVIATFAAF